MRLGFSVGGGKVGSGSANVSWGGKKPGKCRGKGEKGPDSTYTTRDDSIVFSSGIGYFGASWNSSDPSKTTLTTGEIGMGLTLSSECWHSVIKDVVTGCCDK